MAFGSASVGVLQGVSSGTAYGAPGLIDTRRYVTNPGYATPPAQVTYFFQPRDAFHAENLWSTNLSLLWSRRVGLNNTEVFFRGVVLNVFDGDRLTDANPINTTILTNRNSASIAPFNPFTETPVEGVHWMKGTAFGTPTSRFAYQTPRTFSFSLGVRF